MSHDKRSGSVDIRIVTTSEVIKRTRAEVSSYIRTANEHIHHLNSIMTSMDECMRFMCSKFCGDCNTCEYQCSQHRPEYTPDEWRSNERIGGM